MKRDLDLIRNILLAIEASSSDKINLYDLADLLDVDPDTVFFHLELLRDKKFIIAHGGCVVLTPQTRKHEPYTIRRITSDGYDYLDSIKNDTIWENTKKSVKSFGANVSFSVIKTIAEKLIIDSVIK